MVDTAYTVATSTKRARRIIIDENDTAPNAAQCRTDIVLGGRRASRCIAAWCAVVRQRSSRSGETTYALPGSLAID